MTASTLKILESVLGYCSVACWIIVFTPQLWKNYKRKSGESLSVLFLVIWLVGDVFSVAGLFLLELELYQIVLAVYYSVVDAFLIWQVYYYRRLRHAESLVDVASDDIDDKYYKNNRKVVGYDNDDEDDDDDGEDYDDENTARRPLLNRTRVSAGGISSSGSSLPTLPSTVTMSLVVVSCLVQQYQAATFSLASVVEDGDSQVETAHGASSFADVYADLSTAHLIGYLCAYLSAALYVGSRIPQIVKNFRLKSCEGLSIWLFFFSVLGNGTYVLAMMMGLLDKPDVTALAKNIPYFIGSGGTLFFDFTIFLQFFAYRAPTASTAIPTRRRTALLK